MTEQRYSRIPSVFATAIGAENTAVKRAASMNIDVFIVIFEVVKISRLMLMLMLMLKIKTNIHLYCKCVR